MVSKSYSSGSSYRSTSYKSSRASDSSPSRSRPRAKQSFESTYTPGSYSERRSRARTRYETSTPGIERSFYGGGYSGSSTNYSSQSDKASSSANKGYGSTYGSSYSSYTSTRSSRDTAPKRSYTGYSIDRDIGASRSIPTEEYVSRYGRDSKSDADDSYVLGYASVKTRSDPDEPVPHVQITQREGPHIGHARVRVKSEPPKPAPPPERSPYYVPRIPERSTYSVPRIPERSSYSVPRIPERSTYSVPRIQVSDTSSYRSSIPQKPQPRRSYDFTFNTYGFGKGRSGLYDLDLDDETPRKRYKPRSPSVTRIHTAKGDIELDTSPLVRKPRSASVARTHHLEREVPYGRYGSVPRINRPYGDDDDMDSYTPSRGIRARSASVSRIHTVRGDITIPTPSRGLRARSASMTRIHTVHGDKEIEMPLPMRPSRASSVSRYYTVRDQDRGLSLGPVRHPRSASVARTHNLEHEVSYGGKGAVTMGRGDISRMILQPGTQFSPSEVRTLVLPSGQKAVTYEHCDQHGSGNHQEANFKIEEILQRTKHLQDSMHSLEEFVKKNRSWFPEETIIYQNIVFFQLNPEQLRRIGANPDATVYGVKLREKLVVPYGTDVTESLKRYYGKKSSYEIEFRDRDQIKRGIEAEKDKDLSMKDRIRKQVEEEWDVRNQKLRLGVDQKPVVKEATRKIDEHDKYKHMNQHVTPEFLRSFYVNAGLDYDSIYSGATRSVGSTPSTRTSDQESTITTSSHASSRKAKRYDTSPQFMSKLQPKRCHEGQTVRLICSVQGLPVPEVTWFKGNRIINDGGRVRISNNYGLLSLELDNVNKEDQGLYTVKASNVDGEITCSAPLDIEDSGIEQERTGLKTKPYFLVDPINVYAEVGQKAVFEAQGTGKPMPSFKWLKDNISIQEDDKFRVFSDERGNSKLVVKNVAEVDNGLYICIAENSEGKTKVSASMKVVDKGALIDGERPAAIRRRSMSREVTPVYDFGAAPEKGTKPYFIQVPPSEMTGISGEPLVMRCAVDGDPKPKVKWYKGARELQYTNRHRVLLEGDHYLMQIRTILQTDPGEYQIVAENPLGRVKTSVFLKVKAREEGDEDFELKKSDVEYPEFDQYELAVTREQGKMAPHFTKRLPIEKEVKEGESLSIGCKVEEVHLAEEIVGVKIQVKPKTSSVEPEASSEPITEPAIEPVAKSAAETVAEAVITTAMAEAVAEVPDKVKEAKGVAPEILSPLKDRSLKAGGVLKLTVVLRECKPSANVKWFKGDEEITENDHYEIFAEDDSYNCEVVDVESTDSGTYRVTATNEAGSVSSECTVTVEEVKKEEKVEPAPAEAETKEIVEEETIQVTVQAPAETEAKVPEVVVEEAKAEIVIEAEAKEDTVEEEVTISLPAAKTESPAPEEKPEEVKPESPEPEAVVEEDKPKSPEPEPEVKEKTPEPEEKETSPAKEKSPEPEKVKEKSPEPEEKPKSPEPEKEKEPSPEPEKEKEPSPEPEVKEEPPKEKSPEKEKTPEPQITEKPEVKEEEKPAEEKKKKKKKDKDLKSEGETGDEKSEEKAKDEKKKKKKSKEEKSEEEISEESAKEEKKKKKKDKEAKLEESTAEDSAKEEKKKKKKKKDEVSEDEVAAEKAAKAEKKKKKKDKDEESEESAKEEKKKKKKEKKETTEESEESSKEEKKKKKKKDKSEAKEEVVEAEAAVVVEASKTEESSKFQETTIIVTEAEDVKEEETEGTITVEAESKVEEVEAEVKTDEVGAGDAQTEEIVEISVATEEVVSQATAEESSAVEESLTLSMSATSEEAVTVESQEESISITLDTKQESEAESEEEVSGSEEEATAETSITIESSASAEQSVVVEESSEVTLEVGGVDSAVSESKETETFTIQQTGSIESESQDTEEVAAAITLTTESEQDAVVEESEQSTMQTIVLTSETQEAEAESEEESAEESEEESEEEEEEKRADESEIGKGDAAPLAESTEEKVTVSETESGGSVTKTETKTTKVTESEGESHIEVRTITQTRVVEVVEGSDDEDTVSAAEGGGLTSPSLDSPLRGCVVKEGETAHMECKISCDGELEVSWTKGEEGLNDTERLKLIYNGDGVYALTISNTEKSDEGEYTLTASSSGGGLQCTAQILVLSKSGDSEAESEEESEEEEEEEEEEKEKDEDKEKKDKEESEESEGESEEEEESESEVESEEEEADREIPINVSSEKMELVENTQVSSKFSGLFSQAVKLGEFLIRDYIM